MADEARVLDALGDPTRRAVLELLRGGEHSVRELTDATVVSQPAVSQHLRVLRDAGLVTVRAEGTRRLRHARRGWGRSMSPAPAPVPVPPVLRSAQVARPLEETFEVFTRQIGA